MREGWEKKQAQVDLKESRIQVSIQDGLFDKIPVEDGNADLVSTKCAAKVGSNFCRQD
jgi:hypothetical protein